jgi:misacylated tRNA(Ala) deacylase
MTVLLYQTDSYLRQFSATVTAVTENGVALDQTAFYPGGGGQPCDAGALTWGSGLRRRVSRVQRMEGEVWHMLEGEGELPAVGSTVGGEIDWEQRYQLMRTHSALHILCGVVFRVYGALVTGGNMEPLQARMDFEFERMEKDLVQDIESAINKEVLAARPIRVAILSREDAFQIPDLIRTKINLLPADIRQVRVVEIVGLDLQADGGTHVANTSEVGPIKVVDYRSKGRSNKRLVIKLD